MCCVALCRGAVGYGGTHIDAGVSSNTSDGDGKFMSRIEESDWLVHIRLIMQVDVGGGRQKVGMGVASYDGVYARAGIGAGCREAGTGASQCVGTL